MLRPRALAIAAVILAFVLGALLWRAGGRPVGHEREAEGEGEGEGEGERERERESEREGEGERQGERESESPRVAPAAQIQLTPGAITEARMAEIRRDVHLLEIQRLDARERGDHEVEARLDAEIRAARAEHDRLRDTLGAPEGI